MYESWDSNFLKLFAIISLKAISTGDFISSCNGLIRLTVSREPAKHGYGAVIRQLQVTDNAMRILSIYLFIYF